MESVVDEIALLFGDPLDVVSSSLRGFIVPDKGNEFICVDFASIEARITAALADDALFLAAFLNDEDVYVQAACDIYRCEPSEVDAKKRQIGKVAVLSLGYGGGVGAFQMMAKGYGVKVSDHEAESIKVRFREAHPRIVQLWKDLEAAAITAVRFDREIHANLIIYRPSGSFLLCVLPSGREIVYPYPKVHRKETPWGYEKECLSAKWVDSVTRKWERRDLWYGILTENVVQAIARDILAYSLVALDDENFDIVLHVHDEILLEAKKGKFEVEDVSNLILANRPPWAYAFPLELSGWKGDRYRK